MAINIWDVIQGPWMSEKAYKLNNKYQQLVLRVNPQANVPEIRKALEKLFDVKVDDVRVIVVKGKTRRVGRHITHGSDAKKAIVRLKPGYKLDVMGSQAYAQEPAAPIEKDSN